jgi:hypothetical protein
METATVTSQTSPVATWLELPHTIPRMYRLRRLQIRLDHDEPDLWTVVNERAVLSPLAPLSNYAHLDVSINLPHLHPKWETPDKHFTRDSEQLPLTIHRRCRQRQHGVKERDGSLKSKHGSDFPILFGMAEFFYYEAEDFKKDTGEPPEPYDAHKIELIQGELEEWEREEWKEGRDPAELFNRTPHHVDPPSWLM